jgi:hypothetical protein
MHISRVFRSYFGNYSGINAYIFLGFSGHILEIFWGINACIFIEFLGHILEILGGINACMFLEFLGHRYPSRNNHNWRNVSTMYIYI